MRRLAIVVLLCGLAGAALAQAPDSVTVQVGETKTFPLPRQPQILGVEDPSIASLDVLPEGAARVKGLKEGRTRIIGRDHAQVPILIGLEVVAPPPPPPSPSPPPSQ